VDLKVSSVPTVMAYKNGKVVGQFVGLIDDDRIKKFLKEAIDK
jgi:thioredoxin-like negative regulator of GroEL